MVDESAAPFSVSRYDNTFCRIDCNNRGCEELPDAIFILKSVSHLSASGNSIVKISPKICHLRQLKSLDLNTNSIAVVTPEIGLLCCLNLLSLQFNTFRQVPVQLCMLSNLRVLRLEGNPQLQFIPCELALCTQLLQLHVDGCTSLKFPRAKAIFSKLPVVPWLISLKQEAGMNAMNYLKAMLAITTLCATGKRRVADFSDICGADMQALNMIEKTPWHQSTDFTGFKNTSLNSDLMLQYLSEDHGNNDFDLQASRMLSGQSSDRSCIPNFENESLQSVKLWLKRKFPQNCCNPLIQCAIGLLDTIPREINNVTFDQVLRNLIMLDRLCCVLSLLPTDEVGFSMYEELGQRHVAERLSRVTFYCKQDISVPKHRNDIFDRIPETFMDLVACLKSQRVVSCIVQSKIDFFLDGSTLFEQNRSFISELRFNRSDYVAGGDIGCALPNVQCINVDFNCIPKLKIATSCSRLHTLSLKSCQCQELIVLNAEIMRLSTLRLSKNQLSGIDSSFHFMSHSLTSLDLSHNKLVDLPSILETFLMLKYLNCANNSIGRSSVNFKHLRRLTYLNLSKNKLTEIDDGLLQFAAESVDKSADDDEVLLDLSENLIAVLPTGNALVKFGNLSPFKNITKFSFGCNPFRVLPSDFFLLLDRLETVDFHNMKDVLAPAQNVLLAGISSVRRWFRLVAACHESGHLDLSGCQLTLIETSVLEECASLTSIDLSNNAFNQVPLVLNQLAKNVHTLIFDNNCISAASEMNFFPPELSCLTLLRLISMESCGLTKVPETICALDNLCILKLRYNYITFIHPKLCLLTNLKQLDLHGCPISFPPPSILNSSVSLVLAYLRTFGRHFFKDELPAYEEVECCEIDYDWDALRIQWNGHGPAPVPLRCQPLSQNLLVSEYDVVWVRNRELRYEWNLAHFPMPCVTENTFWETCTSPISRLDTDNAVSDNSEKPIACVLFDAKPLHLVRLEYSKKQKPSFSKKRASLSKCGVIFTDIPNEISETLVELCLSFNDNISLSWTDAEGKLSLPVCIRSMTALRVLCLRGCKLDAVPSGLECMLSLVDLDLSFNNIFTVPVELRNVKELRRLLLDSNPLHAWPPALRSFMKLEMLSMQKCRLREIASSHMQTLTSLTSLRLDLNLFNSFPSLLNSRLRAISLNAIHISPASLTCFLEHSARLRMLSLSKCRLKFLPSEISCASSLVDLSIDSNEFSTLPYSFGRCVSMFRLQTSEGQINFPPVHLLEKESIQNGLTLLRAYEDAEFSKNLVLDCIPLEFIPMETSKIRNLTSLSACECGLLNFGNSLEHLPNLASIFFNSNMIRRLPWYIKDMTSLQTLELFNNPLEFPPIDYVASKTVEETRQFVAACFSASQEGFISLSYKSFDCVPSYVFYCDSITSLDISHNFLETIPNAFTAFTSLQTLNVSFNKLSFINPMLILISTLKVINTEGNMLQNVPEQVLDVDDSGTFLIVYLRALFRASILDEKQYIASQLKLDVIDGELGSVIVGFTFDGGTTFNAITFNSSIPLIQQQPDVAKTNHGRRMVDVSEANWYSSKVKSSALSPYAQGQLVEMVTSQLRQHKIDISGANLLLIPPFICSKFLGATINEIRLDNNDLTVLPMSLFKCTAHLQIFSARSNWLICIPVEATKSCPKLTYLDLSHNRFDSAPSHLNECTNLTYLDLSHNSIRSLCSSCFALCPSLADLHLHFNPIEALPSFWTDQHCIKYIGIHGCVNLRALPCTLASTKKLLDIDLCSATISALETPAKFVWKGGFAAVKRFLSKISACVEGGAFDMSNMSVESLPLHLMSSAVAPTAHTCNQIDVGESDSRLVEIQKRLQHMQRITVLGVPSSGETKLRPVETRNSILETAECLPPGYDSEQKCRSLTQIEEPQVVAFEEYFAPKHKLPNTEWMSVLLMNKITNAIAPSALVLDFNPILNLTLSQSQCDDLCSMSLNDCGLDDLPTLVPTWDSLTSLHTLSLDNNLFKFPPSYGLGQLGPSLTQLSMSGCRLEEFPDILLLKLPFLRHLNVESNHLKEIPKAIAHLTCLTNLRMSENQLSAVDCNSFANMSLNELTMFQKKHIHTQDMPFFKLMEGIASRRGSLAIAWCRVYAWSRASLDDIQPWIAKHLELKADMPLTTPVEFNSEAMAYSFRDATSWDQLRKEWQRQVRLNMLPL